MTSNRTFPGTETLVTAAAGFYALGLLAKAAPLIEPAFRWNGDVINGAVIEAYPKQQESLIYLVALVLVPLTCLLGRALWARLTHGNEKLEDLDAAAHLPLFGWVGGYLVGVGSVAAWLAGSALVHIGLRVALHVRFLRSRSDHVAKDGPSPPNASWSREPEGEFEAASAQSERCRLSSPVPGLAAAWGIVILAGIASGLSLATVVRLAEAGTKAKSIGGAVLGVVGFVVLWHVVSWIGTRIHRTRADTMRIRVGISFIPFLVLFMHAFPFSWALFPFPLGIGVISCWVIGTVVTLWRNSDSSQKERASQPRASFARLPRILQTLLWWFAVPAALYTLAYVQDIQGPMDFYHEGERIVPAAAISDGAAPYRDVFIWHGLYENGIKGQISFSLFGESVTGMRQFDRLVEPVGAIVFFMLSWACFGHPLAGLVSMLVYLLLFTPPNVRYLLPYASFAVFAVWFRGKTERALPLVGAGALAGCAVFFSLDGGMGSVVSLLILVVWAAIVRGQNGFAANVAGMIRHIGLLLAGMAAGAVLPLAWLAARDALSAFFQTSSSIVWGLSDRSSRPYGDLLGVIKQLQETGSISSFLGSKILPTYLAPLMIVWGVSHLLLRSRRKSGPMTTTLAVPLAGALVFFRAMIRRPDADHLAKLMPLVYLVVVLLLWFYVTSVLAWSRSERQRLFRVIGPVVMTLSSAAVLCVLTWQESETAPALRLKAHRDKDVAGENIEGTGRIGLDRAGSAVTATRREAAWLENVVGFVTRNSEQDEPLYDFTNKGLFYFLADRPLSTRYPQTTYAATQDAQKEVIADLENAQPKFVLFPSGDSWHYGYDRLIHPFRHPLITRYLYRTYQPIRVIDDLLILKRKGVSDLPEARGVNRYLAHEPFATDLKHLPRLLGERPASMTIVQTWRADIIARQWRASGERRESGSIQNGTFLLAPSCVLSSPKLHILPESVDAVILCLAGERNGRARLQFRSANQSAYGKQGQVDFTIKGDGLLRDYRIEVGLLPSWIWRGPTTGLRLQNRKGGAPIEVERIELIQYPTTNG